jgi:hypothetical protein
MIERPLGRLEPTDFRHVMKYGLTAETIPDKPTPVIAGTNWHSDFDTPVWDDRGRFWIVGKDPNNLGRIRGGHCYCFKPDALKDNAAWWSYYDQGQEGACVGFGISRAMALLNRKRYDAPWLYHEAKLIDEWQGEDYDGTSVRAGLDVVRERGHRRVTRFGVKDVALSEGIIRNRWAESIDDFVAAMHSPRYLTLGRSPFANSWGKAYPHTVWMPLATVDKLLQDGGELAVIYDR